MKSSEVFFELRPADIRLRIWQIIPGILSWGTLIGLTVLSFLLPYWVAIFIIAYDIYVLIRVVYMSVHLLYAYYMLHQHEGIDWITRCQAVSAGLLQHAHELKEKLATLGKKEKKVRWQTTQALEHVQELIATGQHVIDWNTVHQTIVLPTYGESYAVLKTSVESLVATDFPKDRMHVAIGFEEREGEEARAKAEKLTQEFGSHFKTFLTTFHPDGLPGEKRVKSANATWAMKAVEEKLHTDGIKDEQILVSNFDSDTVVSREYFSYLTYTFITHATPYRVSYQPLPLYNNNLWDAPAFSRVIATGSTFWQMIESTRPERLVTFSSHSMTLVALKDVDYWQPDIVSEDSRIFWQCLLRYDGAYRTQPLYTTVSMDAALAPTWWQTLVNQYKQKRRWAWGIENFPFLAEGFLKNKKISWRIKWAYLFRTLEGHLAWATSAIIVAALGWLPLIFGGSEFHSTVLSYSLPRMTRTLMSIAMGGLIISATLSLLLLPRRPQGYSRWRYIFIILQWVLVPIIATLLSAFPALDSETRLMLGRDLNFNVMQKTRKPKL
ncbi:MAG: glycosyltransferase family 2 protein [Candidatus Andersenbacteria bacterium]|nr:glycosyltransferase family 2 protein [Candidatus Andersenbacteria bacterium]